MELEFDVENLEDIKGATLIKIGGNLDIQTVPEFRQKIEQVMKRGSLLYLFDFGKLKYISSAAIGIFISFAEAVGEKKFVIFNVPPNIKVVIDMLGLKSFFKIFNTLEDAKQELSKEYPKEAKPQPVIKRLPSSVSSILKQKEEVKAKMDETVLLSRAAGQQITCQKCQRELIVEEEGVYRCPNCIAIFKYQATGEVVYLSTKKARAIYIVSPCDNKASEIISKAIRTLTGETNLSDETLNEFIDAVSLTISKIQVEAYNGSEGIITTFIMADDSSVEVQITDTGKPIERKVMTAIEKMVSKFSLARDILGSGNFIVLKAESKLS